MILIQRRQGSVWPERKLSPWQGVFFSCCCARCYSVTQPRAGGTRGCFQHNAEATVSSVPFPSMQTGRRRANQTQIKQKKGDNKDNGNQWKRQQTVEKINDTKSWFLEINPTDARLVRLIGKWRSEAQITHIRNERGTADHSVRSIRVRAHYWQFTLKNPTI